MLWRSIDALSFDVDSSRRFPRIMCMHGGRSRVDTRRERCALRLCLICESVPPVGTQLPLTRTSPLQVAHLCRRCLAFVVVTSSVSWSPRRYHDGLLPPLVMVSREPHLSAVTSHSNVEGLEAPFYVTLGHNGSVVR